MCKMVSKLVRLLVQGSSHREALEVEHLQQLQVVSTLRPTACLPSSALKSRLGYDIIPFPRYLSWVSLEIIIEMTNCVLYVALIGFFCPSADLQIWDLTSFFFTFCCLVMPLCGYHAKYCSRWGTYGRYLQIRLNNPFSMAMRLSLRDLCCSNLWLLLCTFSAVAILIVPCVLVGVSRDVVLC